MPEGNKHYHVSITGLPVQVTGVITADLRAANIAMLKLAELVFFMTGERPISVIDDVINYEHGWIRKLECVGNCLKDPLAKET
jgi:hypothetical protein